MNEEYVLFICCFLVKYKYTFSHNLITKEGIKKSTIYVVMSVLGNYYYESLEESFFDEESDLFYDFEEQYFLFHYEETLVYSQYFYD